MKNLLRLSVVLVVGILIFLFVDGVNKMYFHQDDIILMWDVATRFPGTLLETATGHLIFLFKPIYLLEWLVFGLNFPGYLAVSIGLHALTVYTASRIVLRLTKSTFWQTITLLTLVINVNFYEILWMPSSQMMSISTLFSLLSLALCLDIISKKVTGSKLLLLYLVALVPGLNWGTGLIIPICLLVAFWGTGVVLPLALSQATLIYIYFTKSGGEVASINLLESLKFVFFGISYSVLGRSLFPLASRFFRFVAVITLSFWIYFSNFITKVRPLIAGNIRIILLGALVLFGSYSLISISRWQFGLGQAGAPRYAYLPMMFLTIAVTTTLAKLNLKLKTKEVLLVVVMMYTILSLGGFAQVTVKWTERPQKNRVLFQYLKSLEPGDCIKDTVLPWYIVEVDTWTLKDIWPVFKKDFNPFMDKKDCVEIKRDVSIPWTPF